MAAPAAAAASAGARNAAMRTRAPLALFDAHCHAQQCTRKAEEHAPGLFAGSQGLAICATSPDDWDTVRGYGGGAAADSVVRFLGVHPWWSHEVAAPGDDNDTTPSASASSSSSSASPEARKASWLEALKAQLAAADADANSAGRGALVGVGEIGLDKLRAKAKRGGGAGVAPGQAGTPMAHQLAIFRPQLHLAAGGHPGCRDTPRRHVQIHCLQAGGALLDEYRALRRLKEGEATAQGAAEPEADGALKQTTLWAPLSTVMHSYSLGKDMVVDCYREIPECYFSFQYIREGNRKAEDALREVWFGKRTANMGKHSGSGSAGEFPEFPYRSRLLLETDAPSQPPPLEAFQEGDPELLCKEAEAEDAAPRRVRGPVFRCCAADECDVNACGKQEVENEPKNIEIVARRAAEILKVPVEEVAVVTSANAERLYGLSSL